MSCRAAVITVSDKGFRGERTDTSGPAVKAALANAGYDVVYSSIIPDERTMIEEELIKCTDELGITLVVTTGGTGFSPRDVTPEATLAVIGRETRGIPEQMRAESMKITPRGCLSRAVAGIRGNSLIINLPGSERAALENLNAVLEPIEHGVDMLKSLGSADCALTEIKPPVPNMELWLKEAKADVSARDTGMYLIHNGIVRQSARAAVREGRDDAPPVQGMIISCDREKLDLAVAETRAMSGITYVRVWINEGTLSVGEDIMFVLVGGDIRPHVISALEFLVGKIKTDCLNETELI
ncbi:MAG: molybdenum cofactor biosynthesis protein MoaE [Oscillospiraceae bacterium]|nr:molybdenum cofactor biosynthesis protein MoaE [Oscillospiraceae bacterium]